MAHSPSATRHKIFLFLYSLATLVYSKLTAYEIHFLAYPETIVVCKQFPFGKYHFRPGYHAFTAAHNQ